MQHYQWAVVGAGGAGISAVGKLLDAGVNADKILWLDPEFKVGDLGKYWSCVPSNTIVSRLLKFLYACKAFSFDECDIDFPILKANPDKTTSLLNIVEPLQWVTDRFCTQVHAEKNTVDHLNLHDRKWQLQTKEKNYLASNVILANGALPKKLNLPEIEEIELANALNPEKLAVTCNVAS